MTNAEDTAGSARDDPSAASRPPGSPLSSDPEASLVDRLIADYLDAVDRGDSVDEDELIAAHPEAAAALRQFFRDRALVDGVVLPVAGEDASEDLVGQTLGEYVIVAEIARGGMGVVYRARDRRLERDVALKTLIGGRFATPELVARFRREIMACSRLAHENIVPVYDVGSAGGVHFYTMELLEGGCLRHRAPRSRADVIAIARTLSTVARAVHFAHERGVLHRDLKPANVLLDGNGSPHVSDFGLAQILDDDSRLTLSGHAIGSPSYMAPELVDRSRGDPSTRTDVYSLGAILYELVGGEPPFRGASTLETLRLVCEEEPLHLRERERLASRDLEAICRTCLAKRPDDRYGSAAELADDLDRFARGHPVEARAATPFDRLRSWSARNRVALTVGLVLLAGVVVSSSFAALWRAERDLSRESLRDSFVVRAKLGRTSRLPGQRVDGLRALRDAAAIRGGADLTEEAIACLALADCAPRELGIPRPDRLAVAEIDEARGRWVFGDELGRVSVRTLPGNRELFSAREEGTMVRQVQLGPGGRFVAARFTAPDNTASRLVVHDIETGEECFRSDAPVSLAGGAFLGDSGLLVAFESGVLEVRDLAARKSLRTIDGPASAVAARVSSDGSRLALISGVSHVQIIDLQSGETLVSREASHGLRDIDWSYRADRLAVCGDSLTFETWDAATLETRRVFSGHESGVPEVRFAAGDKLLVTTGWDGTLRMWNARTGDQLVSARLTSTRLVRTPGGSLVACTLGKSGLVAWQAVAPSELTMLTVPTPQTIACHPRRHLAAVGGGDGIVLWDLTMDRQVGLIPCEQPQSVVFTPDGRTLGSCGASGIERWRLTFEHGTDGDIVVASRDEVIPPGRGHSFGRMSVSADGSRVAICLSAYYVALAEVGAPREETRFVEHRNVATAALSPDGRWVVCAPFNGHHVAVRPWDENGQPIILPGRVAQPAFSPDGSRLILSTDSGTRLYSTDGWKELAVLSVPDGAFPLAMSPRGAVVAIASSAAKVDLFDWRTGERLTTLVSPAPSLTSALAFSNNGRYLLVSTASGSVQRWDLAALERGLHDQGLDWPLDPFPPEPSSRPARTLRLELR